LKVLTDLRNRGVGDVCVVCCDGLTALPEAIEAVYGDAWVQTCVVHLIRNSLRFVSYKDRKAVTRDLRPIYRAATDDDALGALVDFEAAWGGRYPGIVELWQRAWERFTPFFAFPAEIRRIIYTTNSIEAVNRQLRKVIKTRGHFPTEDAALKLLWLGLMKAEEKWTYPIQNWGNALHQFSIYFPGKVPLTI
jgi:putative transposase